jgi:hypothetical protein
METVLPDSKRFRREMTGRHKPVFRSTLFPVDKSLLRGSNIEELVAELCHILKGYPKTHTDRRSLEGHRQGRHSRLIL